MNKSVATINSPEFINLQPLDINPLMSSCDIKVLYVGENRNRSYISKEVATEMAKTLRGAPIVGYYKEDKQDFADHGERMILDDEGFRFECLTKPYGFVSPDAKVWFKEFEDTDDFGNTVIREYLMTTGYLWTEQFKETQRVVEQGNPQSMELDEETLQGHWSTNNKTGIDFFIISDAIFSKLCILGDDVEPCFEGANVTAPEVSNSFTKVVDDDFKKTLFNMMQELKFALEGGEDMDIDNENNVQEQEVIDTPEVEVTPEQDVQEPNGQSDTDFAKNKDDEDKSKEEDKSNSDDNSSEDKNNEEDDKEKKSKPSKNSLESDYEALQSQFVELKKNYEVLVEFKNEIDNEKKDALIAKFYMLSDEDKKEIIENKAKYSLEEIEAKLSVICFRKKVSFEKEDDSEKKEGDAPITTFNLADTETDNAPAWINAVRDNKNKKEI